tara:strand:- start:153 stop:416 length:264 start_codon:yes stop_codon:yes gene_type:complete
MITLKDLKREQYDLYVGLLTEQQKNDLILQWYAPDCYFNPLQDLNENWIISVEEMANCTNEEFMWVKDLPLILYVPKENPFPPISLN